MKKYPVPIVLSGRILTGGLLGCDRPDLKAQARQCRLGDIKLVAVSAEKAGAARKVALKDYTGFFTATVFDGKRWRKFNLRAGAAVVARYVSNGDRQSKLKDALAKLSTLKDRTSVWADKGYEVKVLVSAPLRKPVVGPPTSSTKAGQSSSRPVQRTLFD